MRKFIKDDDGQGVPQRSQSSNDSVPKISPSSAIFIDTNRKGLQKEAAAFEPVVKVKDNAVPFKEKANQENIENDDDITGPETPGMKPLASNVKRSREVGSSKLCSLRDSGK